MPVPKPNPSYLALENMPADRRCVRIKRDGEQCKQWALKGTTVCPHHGGNAPQVQRKIAKERAQRKVLNQVGGILKRQGVDMDPAEHMVTSLYEAAGMVALWGAFVSRLDEAAQEQARGGLRGLLQYSAPEDELDKLSVSSNELLLGFNRHGEAQMHPFVEQFNYWHDKRFQYAERCVKAGIAERKTRLAEEQGQIVVRIMRAHDLDLERKFGIVIVGDPEYPAMMRRHLALGASSDVLEGSAV